MTRQELVAVDRLREKQLDGLMTKFRTSNPSFHAAYVAASNVVNHPGGNKGKNGSNRQDTLAPTPQ